MSIRYLQLVGSAQLQPTMAKVDNHQPLDFAEYRILQDCANARLDQLIRKFDDLEDLEELRVISGRMAHLLQSSCLALRQRALERPDQALARDALLAQVAYMQACLRRSLLSFDET
ncbi:hypothetical protein [Pseudomonas sp.]|uniref:hypothetical protein n=1 Tax=Pseudomonas sp. TaxID=306 RepID=UPI0028ABC576|nr:hypothetical protein [Pseudomonas sp.]